MYLLGFDVGSSSIKGALVEADTKKVLKIVSVPEKEMPIDAPARGFAEQDPDMWWKYVCESSRQLLAEFPQAKDKIAGIGISYQMHGLVAIDRNGVPLRPSIIWCDSRAVKIGEEIAGTLDQNHFISEHYNLPGNFTFSKLRWVQENQPELFDKIDKIMVPGDYIAFKMTGETRTSITGLSEAILWNFSNNQPSYELLEEFGIPDSILPKYGPTFSIGGYVHKAGTEALGLGPGTKIPVSYRAGDQPNNAWSLNVNRSGIVAGTGGTSAVLYGISKLPIIDRAQKTNSFAHVNYLPEDPHIGTLLVINGAGIVYSWIRKNVVGQSYSYSTMEEMAAWIPPGSDGLSFIPFGNGTERMLQNQPLQAALLHLDLNRHSRDHIIRAGLEGIGFAYVYGYEVMKDLGVPFELLRVGNDNLFQSDIFSQLIASVCDVNIEIREATGAVGAALGSGVGSGYYNSLSEGQTNEKTISVIHPSPSLKEQYIPHYLKWKSDLEQKLNEI